MNNFLGELPVSQIIEVAPNPLPGNNEPMLTTQPANNEAPMPATTQDSAESITDEERQQLQRINNLHADIANLQRWTKEMRTTTTSKATNAERHLYAKTYEAKIAEYAQLSGHTYEACKSQIDQMILRLDAAENNAADTDKSATKKTLGEIIQELLKFLFDRNQPGQP